MRIEAVLVLAYLALCVGIGLVTASKSKSSEDYWVAGRRFGIVLSTLALFSAIYSGGTWFSGVAGNYTYGLTYMTWAMGALGASTILAGPLVSRQFVNLGKRYGSVTIVDFFRVRFPNRFTILIAGIVVASLFLAVIVGQVKIAGIILQAVTGVPYVWAITIAVTVFVFYTALGGMLAVTWTDALQATLMSIQAVLIGIGAVWAFGGIEPLFSKAASIQPELFGLHGLSEWSIAGFMVISLVPWLVMPHVIMRVFAAKDRYVARQMLNSSMLLAVALGLVMLTAGPAAATIIVPDIKALPNPDYLMLELLRVTLHPVLAGIVLAGAAAAVMSTTDGLLLAASATLTNDLVKTLRPGISERNLFRWGHLGTALIGAAAVLLALNPPPIVVVLNAAAYGLIGAAFLWPVVLGIWWKRCTTAGATAGVLVGFLTVAIFSPVFNLVGAKSFMPLFTDILIAVPAAFVATVGVSLLTAPPDKAMLEKVWQLHQ